MPRFGFLVGMVSVAIAASVPVAAQNYVPPQSYNNPDVVVNLDVLGGMGSSRSLRPPGAVRSQALPPLRAPQPVLRPPVANAVPMNLRQPSAPPAVAMPPAMPAPMAAAPLPPATQDAPTFSARDLARSAPLQPVASAPKDEMMAGSSMGASAAPAVPSPVAAPAVQPAAQPARQLLAQAREDAREQAKSDTPPREMLFDGAPPKAPAPVNNQVNNVSKDMLPPPAALDKKSKPETKLAMAPPAKMPVMREDDGQDKYRLVFAPNKDALETVSVNHLDRIIQKMKENPDLRLQLRAYADGTPDTAAQARRLSLSRALSVRNYLLKHDVLATRLDVRALGIGSRAMGDEVGRDDTAPADRVDVMLIR